MREVATAYGIDMDTLRSASRSPLAIEARGVASYLLTRHLHLNGQEAGNYLHRTGVAVNKAAKQTAIMLAQPKTYGYTHAVVSKILQDHPDKPKASQPRRLSKAEREWAVKKYIPTRFCPRCKQDLPLGRFRKKDMSLRDICDKCNSELNNLD